MLLANGNREMVYVHNKKIGLPIYPSNMTHCVVQLGGLYLSYPFPFHNYKYDNHCCFKKRKSFPLPRQRLEISEIFYGNITLY